MTDNHNWLAEYVQTGSDAAFRELVTRYVDLVYSTALRLVGGDTHRAEDVTQTVFVNLARVARALPKDVKLGGWLHRDTCFTASTLMRGERRRQSRERQAAEMNALQNNSEADYSLVAPVLDEAINELEEADRTAVLLRFFEQRDFCSVSQALGSTEDAARMRVARALEKLEGFLKRRGVTTTATSLGVVLSANAVQAAPVGLAVTISTAAVLTGTTIAAAATATTIKTIAMTTLQKTVIAATIAAAVGTGVYQARHAANLRDQVHSLTEQQTPLVEKIEQLSRDHDSMTNRLALLAAENARLRNGSTELLRLRGEVGLLRNDATTANQIASDPSVKKALTSKAKDERLKQLLDERPHQKIPELSLLDERTFLEVAQDANLETEGGIRAALSRLRFIAENQIAARLQPALQQFAQANDNRAPENVTQLATLIDPPIDAAILERYEILNTGTNAAGGWRGGWVISQKVAVDSDYDQRWLISPVGFGPSDFKAWRP